MRRSSLIFKENRVFTEEENTSDKVVIVEDGINIDGIGNLLDIYLG